MTRRLVAVALVLAVLASLLLGFFPQGFLKDAAERRLSAALDGRVTVERLHVCCAPAAARLPASQHEVVDAPRGAGVSCGRRGGLFLPLFSREEPDGMGPNHLFDPAFPCPVGKHGYNDGAGQTGGPPGPYYLTDDAADTIGYLVLASMLTHE